MRPSLLRCTVGGAQHDTASGHVYRASLLAVGASLHHENHANRIVFSPCHVFKEIRLTHNVTKRLLARNNDFNSKHT